MDESPQALGQTDPYKKASDSSGWPKQEYDIKGTPPLQAFDERCDLDKRFLSAEQFWEDYASKSRPGE
jgi:hypothetical protein